MRRSWSILPVSLLFAQSPPGRPRRIGQSLQLAPAPAAALSPSDRQRHGRGGSPTIDGDVLADPVWQQATPIAGLQAVPARRGRAGLRAHRGADDLHPRHPVRRRRLLRQRSGADHRLRLAARQLARQHRQLPDDLRHLPGRAERVRLRHQPGGRRVRRAGDQRRPGRRRPGRGNQQSGSGGGFNLNWDGAWEVRTKTTEIGWMAEFAIPFKTLRYPATADQVWGVNFQRNIRRKNEEAYWAPIPRQFNLYRRVDRRARSGACSHRRSATSS